MSLDRDFKERLKATLRALMTRTDPVAEWEECSSGTDAHLLRLGDALADEVRRLRLELADLDGAVEAVQAAHNVTWTKLAEATAELQSARAKLSAG
jgi:hypothetical protein